MSQTFLLEAVIYLRAMAVHYGTNEAGHISMARQHIQNLERVLQADRRTSEEAQPDAWDSAGPKR